MNQTDLAKKTDTSKSMVSLILSGARRPSWDVAKRFAEVTGTGPEVWLDGTADQRRDALKNAGNGERG